MYFEHRLIREIGYVNIVAGDQVGRKRIFQKVILERVVQFYRDKENGRKIPFAFFDDLIVAVHLFPEGIALFNDARIIRDNFDTAPEVYSSIGGSCKPNASIGSEILDVLNC